MNDTLGAFITDCFQNSNTERAQNPTSGEEKMVTESQHEKEASVALDMKTGQVRYQGILLSWSVK